LCVFAFFRRLVDAVAGAVPAPCPGLLRSIRRRAALLLGTNKLSAIAVPLRHAALCLVGADSLADNPAAALVACGGGLAGQRR